MLDVTALYLLTTTAPYSVTDVIRYGNRAIDIACMLRWSAYAINTAFGSGVVKYCATHFPHLALSPQQPTEAYAFPPPKGDRGGWIGGDHIDHHDSDDRTDGGDDGGADGSGLDNGSSSVNEQRAILLRLIAY